MTFIRGGDIIYLIPLGGKEKNISLGSLMLTYLTFMETIMFKPYLDWEMKVE